MSPKLRTGPWMCGQLPGLWAQHVPHSASPTGVGGSLELGGCHPEDRVQFNGSDRGGGRGSCSSRPDAPTLVLCYGPPPALASQTTAACGESGWSLLGWAQVLGREGGGREDGESCPILDSQALPH